MIALSVAGLTGCAAPVATAIVAGAMASDAVDYYTSGSDGKTRVYPAPKPDPSRQVNAQDCTKPVDYSAGNLLCR